MSDKKKEQIRLFEDDEVWRKEWRGMPEYKNEDLTPYKSIILNFENQKDMLDFSKLVNQTITAKTQSIWYPAVKIDRYINKRYVDVDDEKKDES